MRKRHLAGTGFAVLAFIIVAIVAIDIGCSNNDSNDGGDISTVHAAVKKGDACSCVLAGQFAFHDDGTGKINGGYLTCLPLSTDPSVCSWDVACKEKGYCGGTDAPGFTPTCTTGAGSTLYCCYNELFSSNVCGVSTDASTDSTSGDTSSTDTASSDGIADTSSSDTSSSDTSVADAADTTVADTLSDAVSDVVTDGAGDTASDVASDSGVADTGATDTSSTDAGADTSSSDTSSSDTSGADGADTTVTDATDGSSDTAGDAVSDATFTPGIGCSDSPKTGWVGEYYPPSGYMPPGSVTLQGGFASGGSFWMDSTGTTGTPHCTMVKNGCGGFSCSGFLIPTGANWTFNLRYGDPALTVYGGGWVYDQCDWPVPVTSSGVRMHGGSGADFGTLILKKDNVVRTTGSSYTQPDNGVDGLACTKNGNINPTP